MDATLDVPTRLCCLGMFGNARDLCSQDWKLLESMLSGPSLRISKHLNTTVQQFCAGFDRPRADKLIPSDCVGGTLLLNMEVRLRVDCRLVGTNHLSPGERVQMGTTLYLSGQPTYQALLPSCPSLGQYHLFSADATISPNEMTARGFSEKAQGSSGFLECGQPLL